MTMEEKVAQLQALMANDAAGAEVLEPFVQEAGYIVLGRLYPFGYEDGMEVPARYEHIQVRIALELYSRRGAEGETSHTENGVQRVYETGELSASLLKQITPLCASVLSV